MIALVVTTSVVTAQDKISTDSPFLPPGGAATASDSSAAPAGPVEFCGVLTLAGRTVYGLYDTSTQRGRWLEMNVSEQGWAVRGFDAQRRRLTVEIQGETRVLPMREARFDGQALAQVAPAPNAQQPAGPPPPPVAAPAEEAARLKAVADEIRRRRMFRQKMMTQPAGAPPTPATQGQQ